MVRFENGFRIRAPRPRARAWKRFSTRALPTKAWLTTRSSTSRSWLFSALAMALSRHLRTSREMRFCENSRSASAVATFLPRMSCATRFSFCGETRSMRATALASLSGSARGVAALPILLPLRLLVRRVAVEGAGRRELAELVADHLLGHVDGDVLLPVVDAEGEADELRQDRGAAAPDLDHLVAAGAARGLCLLEKVAVDERSLPDRTCHGLSPYFFLRSCRLDTMNLSVGFPHGVTGWRPPEVRPSPPPCGWSIGFMATPRLCGRLPSQRLRPALPIEMFMWSGFDTAPTVPKHWP